MISPHILHLFVTRPAKLFDHPWRESGVSQTLVTLQLCHRSAEKALSRGCGQEGNFHHTGPYSGLQTLHCTTESLSYVAVPDAWKPVCTSLTVIQQVGDIQLSGRNDLRKHFELLSEPGHLDY